MFVWRSSYLLDNIKKKKKFSKHEEIFKMRSKAGRFISKSVWLIQLHHGLSWYEQTYLLETIPLGKIVCSIGQDCLKIINEIVQEDIKANHNPNIKLLNTEKMVTVTNGIKLLDWTWPVRRPSYVNFNL